MKKIVTSLSLALLLAGASLAQTVNTSGSASSNSQTTLTKNGNGAVLESGTQISGQLQSTLDVKKAKVGDQVILKTTKAIKKNGQVVVKKGSNIVGHVTDVQQKAKGQAMSKLSVVFDSLQNGEMLTPISATIVSLTSIQSSAGLNDNSAGVYGNSSTTSTTQTSAGSSGGGGLLGGVTNTVGGVVNTTTSAVGSTVNAVGNTVGGTTNTVGGTLKGIQISQSAGAEASGSSTLSLQGGNLRLEKGTTFNLKVTESTSVNK